MKNTSQQSIIARKQMALPNARQTGIFSARGLFISALLSAMLAQ